MRMSRLTFYPNLKCCCGWPISQGCRGQQLLSCHSSRPVVVQHAKYQQMLQHQSRPSRMRVIYGCSLRLHLLSKYVETLAFTVYIFLLHTHTGMHKHTHTHTERDLACFLQDHFLSWHQYSHFLFSCNLCFLAEKACAIIGAVWRFMLFFLHNYTLQLGNMNVPSLVVTFTLRVPVAVVVMISLKPDYQPTS